MGMFFSAWAGDSTAQVAGRLNNTLLVSIILTDNTKFPTETLTQNEMFFGFTWYFNLRVCCLAFPDAPFEFSARDAIVIGCTPLPVIVGGQGVASLSYPTQVYLLQLAQVIQPQEGFRPAWQPGINLFSLALPAIDLSGIATTIATAIIDDRITIINVD
jgi:hypothetical protein